MQLVSQSQWGSTLEYEDGTLNGDWDPQYIIIHWGGLTRERSTFEQATASLQSWQRVHLGKGWQDIGYNYAVDELGNVYRLRGENHGGHTSGIDPVTGKSWSTVGVGIVWIGGKADEDGPSEAALQSMATYIAQRNLPVLGHVTTGKATQCPGPFWLQFVEDYNNGEYTVGDTPNLEECLPHQKAAWEKAYNFDNKLINEHTHPLDLLSKGDFYALMERHGFYDTPVDGGTPSGENN